MIPGTHRSLHVNIEPVPEIDSIRDRYYIYRIESIEVSISEEISGKCDDYC